MKTTRKVLLAGTALAVFAANPALAQQQVGAIDENIVGPIQGDNNGDDRCLPGSPETNDGYIINHHPGHPGDVPHGPSDPGDFDPDYTDQTSCVSYVSTSTYEVSTGPTVTYGEVDDTGEDDFLVAEANGTADTSGNIATEVTTHLDVTDPNAPVLVAITVSSAPYGNDIVGNYAFTGSVETLQDALWEQTTTVTGNGTMGTGEQSEYLVTTGNIWFEETTGTSSFEPGSGNVYYTPTAGTTTQMDIDGLHITTLDPSGNETISFNANGVENSTDGNVTSYVHVNPDSVVIHGGTTSTTVTVDNAGFLVEDSTNGTTFQVTNTGNGYIAQDFNVGDDLFVGDNVFVNGDTYLQGGLDVDGNAEFDGDVRVAGTTWLDGDLDVDGEAEFDGNVTMQQNLAVNGTTWLNGDLDVDGEAEFDGNVTVLGQTTTNGISNTGNITNSGNIQTATLNTTGDATIGDDLTVNDDLRVYGTSRLDGDVYIDGILDVDQNAQFDSDVNIDGTITAGNTAGNNVIGGSEATSSTLAAGTSYVQVNEDNVVIHGGTSSTTVVVDDTGMRITNNNTGNVATANGTGANLFIAADGSISSSNTGLNGGAVTVSDQLVVRAGSATAGFGGIQTGTVAINTTGNNKISGLANATLSATSTEAVTGQQLHATNQALAALDAREAAHYAQLMDRADKAYQGVAMNFALNAAPLSLDNGEGGISGGVGYFQGEWAGAVKAQYVTDSGIGVGINVGFSEDAVGGGVGASIKF